MWNYKSDFCVLAVLPLLSISKAYPPLTYETIRSFPTEKEALAKVHQDRSGKPGILAFDSIAPLYRLNDTYLPSKYELELRVGLDEEDGPLELVAVGKVKIYFKTGAPTNAIKLHVNTKFLSVNETTVNLSGPGEVVIAVNSFTYSGDDTHFVTLGLGGEALLLPENEYRLELDFLAKINTEGFNGLYLSNYTDPVSGALSRVAATQMESYHSRQLFPCFDEPGLRAVFSVKVTHRTKYIALGNGDVLQTEPIGDWILTTFSPTVQMPTYLFALVVADYAYVDSPAGLFKAPVRTYAPPHVIDRGGGIYAAEIVAKLLKFFDDYFETDYPMQKMDSVHIPHFSAGAMENWGLNLYREARIIYYPDEHVASYKNALTNTISHEIAHQNFGNLVTCKWWNEIWLNEGFATYLSKLGVDGILPEYSHREWILIDSVQYSMAIDVLASSSHPLINDALSPTQIDGYFSGITYDKGASINRMTENFLTEETYKKGLRLYLKEMSNSGVVSDDLFRNLDIAAKEDNRLPDGLTVKQILGSWTEQKSHPLVRVSVAGPNQIFISQERYADPDTLSLWYIPVTVATKDKPKLNNLVPELWLESNVPIKNREHDTNTWVMINQNGTGYYRVLYDAHLTSLIQQQLVDDASLILPLSRSQLLDDYFSLAFLGLSRIETALDLTKYLDQEDHFAPWDTAFKHLRKVYNIFYGDIDYYLFINYLLPKLKPALDKVGLEQEPKHVGQLAQFRAKLVDWACSLGDGDCHDYSKHFQEVWRNNDKGEIPIPVDIQQTMFCTIVANHGRPDGFDMVFEAYKRTSLAINGALKERLLNGLACASETSILQELLDMTLDPNSGLDNEAHATLVIQRVAMNFQGRALVLSFLKTNLYDIVGSIGNGRIDPVMAILSTLADNMDKQKELDEVLKFITDNPLVFSNQGIIINNYLNSIRNNIAWNTKYAKDIISWLKENDDASFPSFAKPCADPSIIIITSLAFFGIFYSAF